MGGENIVDKPNILASLGSSPRGRGKRVSMAKLTTKTGLIPAWAGKTYRTKRSTSGAWAHPRVGGENSVYYVRREGVTGSSPRGRGKRPRLSSRLLRSRLIPAWAGKTCL